MRPAALLSRASLSLALLAAPSLARAQAQCPPGQSVSADTAGHCCWPAQAWSSARGACVGAPQCPAGTAPAGESCAPLAVAPVAPSALAVQPAAPWGAPAPQASVAPSPVAPVGYAPTYAPTYAPPPEQGVPVRFIPYLMGDRFTVTISTPAGPRQCQVPCALSLPPGEYAVAVAGDAEFNDSVTVPGYPLQVRVRRYRRERMIWGVAGTGLGGALLIGGLAMAGACDGSSSSGGRCEVSAAPAWLITIGSALAIVAATTGFTTMGSNSLVPTADYALYARRQGPRLVGLGAAPAAGGAGLGATLSF